MLSSLCLCYDDTSRVHFIAVHKHPLRGVILPCLCTQGIKQQGAKVSYNRIVLPSNFSSSCDKAGVPRCRRPPKTSVHRDLYCPAQQLRTDGAAGAAQGGREGQEPQGSSCCPCRSHTRSLPASFSAGSEPTGPMFFFNNLLYSMQNLQLILF